MIYTDELPLAGGAGQTRSRRPVGCGVLHLPEEQRAAVTPLLLRGFARGGDRPGAGGGPGNGGGPGWAGLRQRLKEQLQEEDKI